MFAAPFVLALVLTPGQTPPKVPLPAAKAKVVLRVARQGKAVQFGGLRALQPVPPAPVSAPPAGSPLLAAGGVGDENVLKAVKLQTTDDALLDFFRKRTPPAPAKQQLVELVKKL